MKQLIGNRRIRETLAGWLHSGRFPHALLLEGSEGSGRTTLARELACAILCGGATPPCGDCRHCKKIQGDIHPDVILAEGAGGARSFHVDSVRALRANAFVRPNEASGKVFILKRAEEMTDAAQNALLKIMEEPPKGVYFILTTANRQQVLPTILSRATVLTLELPEPEEAAVWLEANQPGKTPEEYQRAALQAEGNLGLAQTLLEDPEALVSYQKAEELLEHLLGDRELAALATLQDCERDKAEFVKRASILRALVAKRLLGNAGAQRFSALQLSEIIGIIDEIVWAAKRNVNMLLLTTLLCARIREAVSNHQ